jgi:hypothetical protein
MAVSTYLWLGLVTKHMTVFGGADLEHDERVVQGIKFGCFRVIYNGQSEEFKLYS